MNVGYEKKENLRMTPRILPKELEECSCYQDQKMKNWVLGGRWGLTGEGIDKFYFRCGSDITAVLLSR